MKILQRGKQSIATVPSQAHNRPKDDRYAQGQNYSWNKGYVKPEHRNGQRPRYSYGPEYGHENKNWGQGGLDDKGSKRNGNGNGKPHGNGGPGGNGDPNGGGGPAKMESHPEKEGKNLLEELENQVEEMGDQTLVMMMGVGMGPPVPHQILHHLEEGGIGGPDLFMWYRDLQDHQVRWDKLVEMEEMGKPYS